VEYKPQEDVRKNKDGKVADTEELVVLTATLTRKKK